MPITVLYADLRNNPSTLKNSSVSWLPGLTPATAIEKGLGADVARRLTRDLVTNNRELIVSWTNRRTGEHSEIGGVGSLDWEIAEDSTLVVCYENDKTTEQQVQEHIAWMLANEDWGYW